VLNIGRSPPGRLTTERLVPGAVVLIPTFPPLAIVIYVLVADRASVDDPMYRFPPAERKKKCLASVPADGSERAS
jgi:hypothetical protein